MSLKSAYLEKIHIQNYLSLHDVKLPLKPLTVLVGPNASGKSNILSALNILRNMINDEEPPSVDLIKNRIWAGGARSIRFKFETDINGNKAVYTVELKPIKEKQILQEKLIVNGVEVIFIKNGRGKVKDEDDSNETIYQSKKLSLTSAGDYGNKPITNALNEFIGKWEFYNFDPDLIRNKTYNIIIGGFLPKELDSQGVNLRDVLIDWHKNARNLFNIIYQTFEAYSFQT